MQIIPATAQFSAPQLALIQNQCAPKSNRVEFDTFIETAKLYGLNPLKKEIMCTVYNANNPDKRSMAIVTTINGFRVIASRSGTYRPAEEPTKFECDESLKSDLNPKGIERAIVTVFKQDSRGQWYKVVGEAWWDEHAKVKDKWVKGQKTDEKILEDNWSKMARLMIAKCAEAQALRKGWPEMVGGLYEEAEIGETIEGTATEIMEAQAIENRKAAIGNTSNGLGFIFDAMNPIESIPLGQVFDRVSEFVESIEDIGTLNWFMSMNQMSLKAFWAEQKDDALVLKQKMEKRKEELSVEKEAA